MTIYVQLHTGHPRPPQPENFPTAKFLVTTGTVAGDPRKRQPWTDGAATWGTFIQYETVTHISVWDAAEGGSCLWGQIPLRSPVTVRTGDTLTITDLGVPTDGL